MTAPIPVVLGRRVLAAHPSPYRGLTCAQVHVRTHVHVKDDDRAHFHMPEGCAACGREWFAEDEITYMGYCGDCWPGNSMLWDWSDGVEVVAATYPQPVRHRGGRHAAQGRANVAETFGRLLVDKPVFARATCSWCGASGEHALDCPYGPVMQYVRRSNR